MLDPHNKEQIMEDFDSIFSPPADTDTELANASAILNKIAADTGVDLNKLSEEDIAELLTDLLPPSTTTDTTPTPTKEAQMTTQLTTADVALELSKIASDDGIDMSKVSKEEYAEAFDALAARMSDPSYAQTKVAAEEEEAKLAEAYNQGARMADGFLDRFQPDRQQALLRGETDHHQIGEDRVAHQLLRQLVGADQGDIARLHPLLDRWQKAVGAEIEIGGAGAADELDRI